MVLPRTGFNKNIDIGCGIKGCWTARAVLDKFGVQHGDEVSFILNGEKYKGTIIVSTTPYKCHNYGAADVYLESKILKTIKSIKNYMQNFEGKDIKNILKIGEVPSNGRFPNHWTWRENAPFRIWGLKVERKK